MYKQLVSANDLIVVDNERNIMSEMTVSSYREDLKDFINVWTDHCMEKLDILFRSKNDRKVADAILTLFKHSGELELFNKKELYVLIREHSKLDTQYITRVIQILKNIFYEMFEEYQNTGQINN